MNNTQQLHVVFGYGQVGESLVQTLLGQGKRVRLAVRSKRKPMTGVEIVNGDVLDEAFCLKASEGASVIYNCVNSPYFARVWAKEMPVIARNFIRAAEVAKAKLVVLDCLYMYGNADGKPMNELTVESPVSGKGRARAAAGQEYLKALHEGRIWVALGRPSDFYGPLGAKSHLGDQFWPNVLKGRAGLMVVNPEMKHTYQYVPDVANGLAVLGDAEEGDAGIWMLPCHPAESARELVDRLAKPLGRPIKIFFMPRFILKFLGLFMPLMREVDEMMYQWDRPFVVDDSKFRKRFGTLPTPKDIAAAATVEWAKKTYGANVHLL